MTIPGMLRRAGLLVMAAAILAVAVPSRIFAADNINGLWLQVSDNGKPESVAYLYMFGGMLFGRMMAAFNPDGSIIETIEKPLNHAEKLKGSPFFMNLDYIYRLKDEGKEWRGSIMDPRSGDEYNCRIWKEGDKLIVRGQLKGILGFIGRNQVWKPLPEGMLPADLVLPDPTRFIPVIPERK